MTGSFHENDVDRCGGKHCGLLAGMMYCGARVRAVQKRPNRSRCRLGADSCESWNRVLDGVKLPYGKGVHCWWATLSAWGPWFEFHCCWLVDESGIQPV